MHVRKNNEAYYNHHTHKHTHTHNNASTHPPTSDATHCIPLLSHHTHSQQPHPTRHTHSDPPAQIPSDILILLGVSVGGEGLGQQLLNHAHVDTIVAVMPTGQFCLEET